ncbi:MAG: phosphomevalonate decarboxylase MvaD [Salinirussus sp.]
MKATARAHPIQGLVKYHGMRDSQRRLPYHDSISVCTAPARTITTVAFQPDRREDEYVVDGDIVEGRAADRIRAVVDRVRALSDIDDRVRLESENSFQTNVGLGSSSSGFAAAATAVAEAAGLDVDPPALSAIARRGSASAARAVTGAFSHLRTGLNDRDCRSERIDVPAELEDELRIVVGLVPAYKETEAAHTEAAESHMFESRLAHIHEQIAECRDALFAADFDRVFELAEHDSLSLAATTMTGPAGWVYWRPRTLEMFAAVRRLRDEEDIPAYFSVDTGATVYVNTTQEYADQVEQTIADCDVETRVWRVGGPARVLEDEAALF